MPQTPFLTPTLASPAVPSGSVPALLIYGYLPASMFYALLFSGLPE